MAARDTGVSYDQLHHFIASGVWDAAPLEAALLAEADRQVGGDDAWLIVDDTALPKKGRHSVGVAPQYASTLGKNANCQTLVSLTLASGEVPVMVGLRLFLPESWTSDSPGSTVPACPKAIAHTGPSPRLRWPRSTGCHTSWPKHQDPLDSCALREYQTLLGPTIVALIQVNADAESTCYKENRLRC